MIRNLCIVMSAFCLSTRAAEVSVELPPGTEGKVTVVLFDSANTFGDFRDPVRVERFDVDGELMLRITGVVPGEYALVAYLDENGNDLLDENFIGIPREPLGFSNGYRPKGPPSYSRARFELTEGEARHFDIDLYRPLGKRGRIGVGVGVIARSSPYRDSDSSVVQAIPAITYIGERIQVFGPVAQLSLFSGEQLRLAATARYRLGAYEEDDSPVLEGLGDREDTLMAGLALQLELPAGIDLALRYDHDVLDEIGGGASQLALDKSFQWRAVRLSPRCGLNWLSEDLANHDYGTLEYQPGDSVSFEAGLGTFIEINRDWRILLNLDVEILPDEVTDSPIVSEDYVVKGFAAITYLL